MQKNRKAKATEIMNSEGEKTAEKTAVARR